MRKIETFDEVIREMLRHDIHYNKTCSLEDGKRWRKEDDRRSRIVEFCKDSDTARSAWHFFTQGDIVAANMIQNEALLGHPITEGFIEAVISNV